MVIGFILGVFVTYVVYKYFLTFNYVRYDKYNDLFINVNSQQTLNDKAVKQANKFMVMYSYVFNKFRSQLTIADMQYLDSTLTENNNIN